MSKKIIVYTDGGSRGNPGKAAIGIFIKDEKGNEILSYGEEIGIATNNVAEYKAILTALSWLCKHKEQVFNGTIVHFFMDSELAYKQLVGLYKIKNTTLRDLLFQIREKEAELGCAIIYSHIRREKNKKADTLVNRALDNLL